jgi:hypothetical protein
MPFDPEMLIQMSKPLKATLRHVDPLDPEVRLLAIEAVRRILRRYSLSAEEQERIAQIYREHGSEKIGSLSLFLAADPPDHFHKLEQEEIDARIRHGHVWIDDPADRRLLHRKWVERSMTLISAGDLIRWLFNHSHGATPAEVDLLASLHDEFIHTNVETAWANLLRAVAPDRARQLAKTTSNVKVAQFLLSSSPDDQALIKSRFPSWSEDERQRELDELALLDPDEM